MKFCLSLVGIVCLYVLAFKVNVVVSSVMLVAHTAYEYIMWQEMKRQAAQAQMVYQLLSQTGVETTEEPPHSCGNC